MFQFTLLRNDPFSASRTIPILTRISQNVFLNLRYEDHNNLIGTELSNLMVSSILVSYFLAVYLFQPYCILAICIMKPKRQSVRV